MKKNKHFRLLAALMAALMVVTCMPQTSLYAAAEELPMDMEMMAAGQETETQQEDEPQIQTNTVPASQGDTEEGIELLDGENETEKPPYLTNITLDKTEVEIDREKSKSVQLTIVTREPSDALDQAVKWESSNSNVATVDDYGLVTLTDTAKGNDEAYISVKATNALSSAFARCHVTVKPIYVDKITLSTYSLEMTVGDKPKSFTVDKIEPDNADNKELKVVTVRPTSSIVDIAEATLSADKKTVTVSAKHAGTASVFVYATDRDEGADPAPARAECVVKINPKPNPVDTFSIEPSTLELYEGGRSFTLNPKYVGIDPKEEVTEWGTLEWKVEPSDTKLVDLTQDGRVTPGTLPADYDETKPPTVTVKATLTMADGTVKKSTNECKITIKRTSTPVTGISMGPSTLLLKDRAGKAGNTDKLTIRLAPENAGNKEVKITYSPEGEDTAAYVTGPVKATVDAEGKCEITVQALPLPEGVQSKTCTITVVPSDNSANVKAECKVTVTKYVEQVTGLTLSDTSLRVQETKVATLTATITPADADNKKITWRTTNADMAVLVNDAGEEVTRLETTAGDDGKSTVRVKGISLAEDAATCEIVALTNDGSIARTCTVTVEESEKPVTGITLDKTELILKNGSSGTLTATVSPADAEYSKVTWSVVKVGAMSSAARVEPVSDSDSKNRTVTVTALHAGTCQVIARAGRQTVRCEVTVREPSMEVTPKELRYSVKGEETEQPTLTNIRRDLKVLYYSLEDADHPYENVTADCALTLIVRDEDAEEDIEYLETDSDFGDVLAIPGKKKLRIEYQPEENGKVYTETITITVSENPPAELVRIGRLDKVWNVANGTTPGKLPLPETVDIYVQESSADDTETDIFGREKKMSAQIDWNRSGAAYNPNLETGEQNFTVTGTVVLPGDVRNTAGVPLTVQVEVNVREKYTSRQAEQPRFSVYTHQTVAWGTEVVITSETEGASIYYTINGNAPTRDDLLYQSPIRVTAATTVIRAIACKKGCMQSDPSECTVYTSKDLVVSDDPDDVEPDDVTDEDKKEIGGKVPNGLWVVIQKEENEKDGFAYTGSAIKPEVHVYDHTRRLTEKKDYTLTYKNNVNAGDAKASTKPPTVTVTGKGNYEGKADATFTIKPQTIDKPKSIDDKAVTMDEYVAAAYTGKAQKPVPALFWNGKKLTKNKDFTYQETAYSEPGEYKITVTGIGNYTGTRTMTYEIIGTGGGVLVTKLTFSKIANQEYTGKAITPEVTVKYKQTVLTKDQNYTVTYVNNKNVGTASAIITGLGSYRGSKRIDFKITPAAKMSQTGITLTFDPAVPIYTGEPIRPAYTVSYQSKTGVIPMTEGKDYKVTFQNNNNAGTASVSFTGMGAYTGTVKKTFKIQAYDITQLSAKMENSYAYEKNGCKPKPEIVFGSTKLKEGTDYTLSYRNHNKIGNTAVVTIKGKGNFKGTITKPFAVTMKNISECTVVAADKPFQNRANIYKTSVKVLDTNGVALKAGTDYDTGVLYTYASGMKQGQQVMPTDIIPLGTVLRVEVRVTNPRTYQGTVYGTYRIVQANIAKAKVTVDTQTYTGLKIRPGKSAIHVTMNGMPLGDNDYEIVGYENNVNQGTAKVTIRGKGNYGGTKTVNFKIKKKGILSLIF